MYYLVTKIIYVSGNHDNRVAEFPTAQEAKAEFHSRMGELMKSTRTSQCSLLVTDWANHVILSDSAYIQPTEAEQAEIAAAQAESEAVQAESEAVQAMAEQDA